MRRQIFSHLASQFFGWQRKWKIGAGGFSCGLSCLPPAPHENVLIMQIWAAALLIRKSARSKASYLSPRQGMQFTSDWHKDLQASINTQTDPGGQGKQPIHHKTNKFGQPPIRCWKLIGNASRPTEMEEGCGAEFLLLRVKFEFGSWKRKIQRLGHSFPFRTNLLHFESLVMCRKKFLPSLE